MQETSRIFMRDGRALQADLERLKADLMTLHAQAQLDAASAAPLPTQPYPVPGSGPLGMPGADTAAAYPSATQSQAPQAQ